MEKYDVKCPICGEVNRGLFLDETDGWMECEKCMNTVQLLVYARTKRIPVYTMDQLPLIAAKMT